MTCRHGSFFCPYGLEVAAPPQSLQSQFLRKRGLLPPLVPQSTAITVTPRSSKAPRRSESSLGFSVFSFLLLFPTSSRRSPLKHDGWLNRSDIIHFPFRPLPKSQWPQHKPKDSGDAVRPSANTALSSQGWDPPALLTTCFLFPDNCHLSDPLLAAMKPGLSSELALGSFLRPDALWKACDSPCNLSPPLTTFHPVSTACAALLLYC